MERKGPVTKLKEDLKNKEREIKEFRDKYLRALADMDNFRKRMDKELDSFRKYAQVEFFNKIIPVLDSFERAMDGANLENDHEKYAEGVEMIYRQLKEVLKSMGLEEFSSLGELFDPARHEAVATIVNDDKPENTIVEEISKGYIVKERVIKPAKVLVSKQNKGGNEDVENNRD
ncbi:MAG: nucleotide exchange factor GrpE [candidate division WOR-3 bacterium]|nr:MAG: nucleotide exchange factor GrpE [candidate division WOR-3 bacterium]